MTDGQINPHRKNVWGGQRGYYVYEVYACDDLSAPRYVGFTGSHPLFRWGDHKKAVRRGAIFDSWGAWLASELKADREPIINTVAIFTEEADARAEEKRRRDEYTARGVALLNEHGMGGNGFTLLGPCLPPGAFSVGPQLGFMFRCDDNESENEDD